MIIKKEEHRQEMITLDLTGPEGNAFVLLGYAKRLGSQLGLDSDAIVAEMMSSDYEHLVEVFDREFGDLVLLLR